MSETRRVLYRFAQSSKVEVMTARGKVFVFNSLGSGDRVTLRENEYDLASLFNGRRSEEEIRDLVLKAKGLVLTAEDLRDFIDKLKLLGLLEEVNLPTPVVPRRRLALAKAQHDPSAPEADAADFDGDEAPDEASSGRPLAVQRGKRGPRRSTWREAPADGYSLDESWDAEDSRPGQSGGATDVESDFDEGNVPPSTDELLDEAFAGSGRRAARGAATAKPRASRLLFRLPVRWLLPLATPLGWAGRSRLGALALCALLAALVFGLWLSRVEVARDLERWLLPTTIAQTLALALITVNLWAQLARAAEYRRQTGEVPPFGMALAWNFIPVFAVDLSGLARARNILAARAVFGASLSAIATICVLTYTGWLASKNNGTALPLLMLGIALLASTRLVLSLNPLGRRDGYYFMALSLGIPDLRQRAFATLLRRDVPALPPSARVYPPGWILMMYGLALVAYLIAVLVLATIFIGGWLEAHWGGFGVVLYIAVLGLVFLSPIQEARARRAQRSRAVQRYRKRTLGQRLWSMAKLAVVVGGLVVVGLVPYRYEPGGEFVLRPLQAGRTDVRSVISGRVNAVLVKEGDRVEVGQLLARISADEERKNVQSTEANIRALEAQLSKAVAGATREAIAVARQKVSTAKTRLQYSQAKADRWAELQTSGFVSDQDYANARGQADTDREQLLQAEKELAELLAGTRPEEIATLRAAIDEQKANLQYHRQQQLNAEIRAPIAGYVVSGSLIAAAGNYLKNGDLLLAIEDASELVAEVQVPQFDIGFVRVGAPIRLKAWTLPDVEVDGKVVTIAPAAEQTPAGKTVRVTSEIDNRGGLLKSGMTGYAKIGSEEMPVALAFTRWVMRFLRIELWSWLP